MLARIQFYGLFVLTCFLGLTVNRAMADVQMHVTMSARTFYVGQEFYYEVLLKGVKEVKVHEVESGDDLQVQYVETIHLPRAAGFHQGTGKPNPREEKLLGVVVRYRVIPMKPGSLILPIFSMDADGQELMTADEEFIDVLMPEGYPGLSISRHILQRDYYVGEPFRADYQWRSPLHLSGYRAVQLHLPILYQHHFKVRAAADRISGDDKAAISFPVSNTRLIARYSELKELDTYAHGVSFSKIVQATIPGECVIPSTSLLASYVEPPEKDRNARGWKTSYPSYFNNNFFEVVEDEGYKKYFVRSGQQTLHILPLPEAGQPHDFAGEVGSRQIKVTASPKVLAAGDPITLSVEVSVNDFPEFVEMPDISKQVAFTRQFAIADQHSRGRIHQGKKTFVLTLRPRTQDVSAIPSVRLPYFDPQTKSYAVAESGPIAITVKAAEVATAFDAVVSGSTPLRNVLEKNPDGIRANSRDLVESWNVLGLSRLQLFYLILLLPPLGYFMALQLTRVKRLERRDPVKARAQGAFKHFKKSIRLLKKSISGHADEAQKDRSLIKLDHIIRRYFSDRLNLAAHAHTFAELEVILQNRAKELAVASLNLNALRIIYSCCEEALYRSAPPFRVESGRGVTRPTADDLSSNSLIRDAEQCIVTIQQKLYR